MARTLNPGKDVEGAIHEIKACQKEGKCLYKENCTTYEELGLND